MSNSLQILFKVCMFGWLRKVSDILCCPWIYGLLPDWRNWCSSPALLVLDSSVTQVLALPVYSFLLLTQTLITQTISHLFLIWAGSSRYAVEPINISFKKTAPPCNVTDSLFGFLKIQVLVYNKIPLYPILRSPQ